MGETLRLEWHEIAPSGAVSLVVRHGDFPAASQAHTHDFAEVFVVESGSAVHDRDGGEHPLEAGDVVFVAPETVHRFVTPTADFRLTNVAFPEPFLSVLKEAIPEAGPFWSRPPSSITLDGTQRARVLRVTHDLARTNTRLVLVQLLVEILLAARAGIETRTAPAWVYEALEEWQKDEVAVRQGVAGLAAIAGRSREHVSRTISRAMGERAIDVTNATRLELAATLLRTSDDSIARVALRVGFSGLSHFYRLFKQRFGVTPGRYRSAGQAVLDPRDRSTSDRRIHGADAPSSTRSVSG